MITYQDNWSRWHDKKCPDRLPSSNNGWKYTAIAIKLGFPVDHEALEECFKLCKPRILENPKRLVMDRSPGKSEPPMSHDEITGMHYCKVHTQTDFNGTSDFCPYEIPKFNPIKSIAAMWRIRPKNFILWGEPHAHRNALWNEPHAYRFNFKLPLDTKYHMILESGYERPSFFLKLVHFFYELFPHENTTMRWLKGGKFPEPSVWVEEFGDQHPFTIEACKRYVNVN
jgi:hypothetical protein